ncbi:EamA domain-containing membrane protein RarD [Flavobacterium cauense R2A-7]|uniref:EamA domain-containing membrane protein RarD n=1 Tax=Flavobacterium cauense R2A-7 TaxID=1341154 RepID=A0A562LNJ9_9FLAO|nr:DMT family transporter [Flavobacterium cauense]KGO79842.1 permease [Flavobacterium cauense R2A-7]TWI09191.1 EamA domain-containing membrane protein RarD [Flavobacterium cauense R2A-7]
MPSDKLKSYFHLHFIVFIWGFTAVLGKLISLDALPLVWYRMIIAVTIIFLYVKIRKIPLLHSKRLLIGFLFSGLVIAMHWLTFFHAIKVSNISVTLACLSTGALFASVLEPVFYGKKIVLYEVFFGLLVVLGLGIIFKVEGNYIEGIVLALTSAFLSALFSVINGKFAKYNDAAVITFYELLGGVGFLSIYLLFSGSFTHDFFQISLNDLIWLLVLGSFCTAYAFLASVKVMKYLTPYTVMLTINMEPIYGIILGILVFSESEKMSTEFYIGASIILITVILNGVIKNYKKVKN